MVIFEIIFGVLVISDMILTYMIIFQKKGVEVGKVAKWYIKYKWPTWLITAVAVVALVAFIRFVQMRWMFILADAYMIRLTIKNVVVYNGR